MALLTPIGTVTGYSGAIEKPSQKYGSYDFKLAFTNGNANQMKKDIDQYMLESLAQGNSNDNATPPYKRVGDELVVTFRRKAEITTKDGRHFEFDVRLFDSKGKPVEELLGIGEGTELIVSYTPYIWDVSSQGGCGITMQPDMIQVVNLVKYEGGVGGNPFGETEGTYEAAKKDGNPFEESKPTYQNDDDGDF